MAANDEMRICLRKCGDGRTEISAYHPQSGREERSGFRVPESHLDGEIRKLKDVLERKGYRCSVVRIS